MTGLEYIKSLKFKSDVEAKCISKVTAGYLRGERQENTEATPYFYIRGNRLYYTFGRVATDAEVDFYEQVWKDAKRLLAAGLSNVGGTKYNWWYGQSAHTPSSHRKTSKLKFALATMTKGWVTSDGYLRRAIVKSKLKEMLGYADKIWAIKMDASSGTLASATPGFKCDLNIGGYNERGSIYVAGFLVHEMGHNVNLIDVCKTCNTADIEVSKTLFAVHTPPSISCSTHGSNGQYIGSKNTVELAKICKNMAVWHCDSYRWYCSSFFVDEVVAGATGKGITADAVAALALRLRGNAEK